MCGVGIIPGQHLPAWDESLTMVTIAGGDRYGGRRRRVLDEWCWVTEVSRSRDPISRLTFTSLMFTGHWTPDLDLDTALTIELITLRYLHFPVICDHTGKNFLGTRMGGSFLLLLNYHYQTSLITIIYLNAFHPAGSDKTTHAKRVQKGTTTMTDGLNGWTPWGMNLNRYIYDEFVSDL